MLLGSSVSEASAGSQGNHGDLCASSSWDEIAQDGKRGYFKLDSFEGKSAYLKAFIFSSLVLKRSKRISHNSLSSISTIVLNISLILPRRRTATFISLTGIL